MVKIWAFIRHNSGIISGVPICIFVLIWAYACQSTVISLIDTERKVNREELLAEVELVIARAETKFADLDRQDLVKNTIFNHAIGLLQGGRIDPAGLALLLGNILGFGAIIDNVRKRTLINTLKGDILNDKLKEKLKEINAR